MSDTDALIRALGVQRQIDEDGDEVAVSRYAVDVAIEEITRLRAENAELKDRLESVRESLVQSAVHEFSYGHKVDELRAQIDAHEKVCSGAVVPALVNARLNELLYIESVLRGRPTPEALTDLRAWLYSRTHADVVREAQS